MDEPVGAKIWFSGNLSSSSGTNQRESQDERNESRIIKSPCSVIFANKIDRKLPCRAIQTYRNSQLVGLSSKVTTGITVLTKLLFKGPADMHEFNQMTLKIRMTNGLRARVRITLAKTEQ